jgi:hypothetical protein
MRTWGRIRDVVTGEKTWMQVSTDPAGYSDGVWLTTLVQVLKLNLGESPFWADWGIPGYASVVSQIPPDFYVTLTQQRLAPHFMTLTLQRMSDATDDTGRPTPYYALGVTTNWGAYLTDKIPI